MEHLEKEQRKLNNSAAHKQKEAAQITLGKDDQKLFDKKKPFSDEAYENALINHVVDKRE